MADTTRFVRDYKPELDRLVAEREKAKDARKADSLSKLMKDINISKDSPGTKGKGKDALEEFMEAEEDESSDDDDGEIIDRSEFLHFLPSFLST